MKRKLSTKDAVDLARSAATPGCHTLNPLRVRMCFNNDSQSAVASRGPSQQMLQRFLDVGPQPSREAACPAAPAAVHIACLQCTAQRSEIS